MKDSFSTTAVDTLKMELTQPGQFTSAQVFKANHLLKMLNIKILDQINQPWRYVIIQNSSVATGTNYSGKYAQVNYKNDLALSTAGYSSVMFVIEKTNEETILIDESARMLGEPSSIYSLE